MRTTISRSGTSIPTVSIHVPAEAMGPTITHDDQLPAQVDDDAVSMTSSMQVERAEMEVMIFEQKARRDQLRRAEAIHAEDHKFAESEEQLLSKKAELASAMSSRGCRSSVGSASHRGKRDHEDPRLPTKKSVKTDAFTPTRARNKAHPGGTPDIQTTLPMSSGN